MKNTSKWFTFIGVFLLASCVSLTVNVYFPTTEIKQAAEEIEKRVRTGQGTEGLEQEVFLPTEIPSRRSKYRICLSFGAQTACAAENDINIDLKNPIILNVIKQRTKRYKEIEPEMKSGLLGEGMDGYLAIRETKGLDLKVLTSLKKLIKEENADREIQYKEILKGNDLEISDKNMIRVGETFAEVIRKELKEGYWYEIKKDPKDEKGTWMQKEKKK